MMKMQKIAIILLLIRYRIKRSTTITPIKSIVDAISQAVFNYNERSANRQSSKTMRFLGNRKSKNKVAILNVNAQGIDTWIKVLTPQPLTDHISMNTASEVDANNLYVVTLIFIFFSFLALCLICVTDQS